MSHVMVWRGSLPEDSVAGFWHHGILGQNGQTVIHYSGMEGVKSLSNAQIMRTDLSEFQTDTSRRVHTVTYDPNLHAVIYPPSEVEQRAASRIGHAEYDLMRDNCESFARWCVTGREVSQQSTGAVLGVAAGLASMVCGGGLLGGMLVAVVTQKAWDRRGNRSSNREPPVRFVSLSFIHFPDSFFASMWEPFRFWASLRLTRTPRFVYNWPATCTLPHEIMFLLPA